MRSHSKAPSVGSTSVIEGSGASSRRRLPRLPLIALAVALIAILLPLSASAAEKSLIKKFGTPNGSLGGQLRTVRGIAVNRTGAGGATAGDVYVVDGSNTRIQVFSPTGTFIRAFGKGVNETTGGDICTAASHDTCKAGVAGVGAGTFGSASPQAIAIDQSTGAVYISDNTNRRISVFSAAGSFEGAFGWGVDTGASALEFCTIASVCQASASAGGAAGQFGTPFQGNAVAVDPNSGHLYVTDPANLRLDEFAIATNGSGEVTGVTFVRAIGWTTISNGAEGTGNLNGTATVSNVATTKKAFAVGQEVTAPGLPGAFAPGTTIQSIASTQLTLSKPATAAATGVTLVVAEGTGAISQNEKQVVTVGATAITGSFKLKFEAPAPQTVALSQSTATIPYNATAAQVQSALEALTNIGPNVTVTVNPGGNPGGGAAPGGPWTVEFNGTRYSSTNVAQLTVESNTTGATVSAEPGQEGTGLETCTAASGCQAGTPGSGPGQFIKNPGSIAVDSAGYIYAVNVKSSGNCSVVEPCRVLKFNPDGTFKEVFGPTSGECQLNYTSGEALKQEAFDIAVDPSDDSVYVSKRLSEAGYKVYGFDENGGGCDVFPSSAGALEPPSGVPNITNRGLAVGTEERLYTDQSAAQVGEVSILGPVPPPGVEVNEIKEIGPTSATFVGTVTPPELEGIETTWRFEYSTDQSHWTSVPASPVKVNSAPGEPESVERTAVRLLPNTPYFVRLCAAATCTTATEFTTAEIPPTIVSTYAEDVTKTEATLVADVVPNHLLSTYHFEWATQAEWEANPGTYGHRVPAKDRQIGAGSEAVTVHEELSGLAPASRYHFRVVATNAADVEGGSDAELETLNEAGLPNNRGYELVSPADKRPIGSVQRFIAFQLPFQAADDGQSAVYPILNGLPDATAGGEVRYMAHRDKGSWSSEQVSGPSLIPPAQAGFASIPSTVRWYAPDLSCGLVESNQPISDEIPPEDLDGHQVTNLFIRRPDESYSLVSPAFPANPDLQAFPYYVAAGASTGCDRVFYQSRYELLPGTSGLYEWDQGALRDAGIRPDGTPVPPGANSEFGFGGNINVGSSDGSRYGSVSPGGRAFFNGLSNEGGDAGKKTVFVRKGSARATGSGDLTASSTTVANVMTATGSFVAGQTLTGAGIPAGTTIASVGAGSLTLSRPATATAAAVALKATEVVDVALKQGGPNDSLGANYEVASPDGSHVFFTANYGLTATSSSGASSCAADGDGCDLYDYDVDTGVLQDISPVSSSVFSPKGASVAGVVDVSEDGSYVYLAAKGQLTEGEGKKYDENNTGQFVNVYLYHEGDITYVATIRENDLNASSGGGTRGYGALVKRPGGWNAQATPDGLHLLFDAKANITGYDSGGAAEAYLFSAESGRTVCVSCRPDGLPSVGYSGIEYSPAPSTDAQLNMAFYVPRTISDDGKRVFFTMPDVLAPGAVSGKENVYEWEDGQVNLLAPESLLVDSSRSGDDVFVTSIRQLEPRDTDFVLDLYDVRVDGESPPPIPPPTPCDPAEGECQGPAGVAPRYTPPASAGFSGPGNPPLASTPTKCPKGKVKRRGQCVRKSKRKRRGASKKAHHRRAHSKRANGDRGGAK